MGIPGIKALLFMKGKSERVPGKNMKDFCNKPLFFWIMESLSNSQYIKEIIINTDSLDVAKSAKENFDVTIHMRPDYLLNISSNEAYQLMAYDLEITEGEYFLQTHSTTPLVKSETIDRAIETFFSQTQYDSLLSVTPLKKRLFTSNGVPINHDPNALIRTQELPVIYEENSCIYIFSRKVMNTRKNRIGSKPLFFDMDPLESIDIDEIFDFITAESIMKQRLQNGVGY